MAKQKFGLGRGLDALISGASEVMAAQQSSRVDEENILHIPINAIIPNPRQPRRILTEDDPKLLELSISIKQYGLLQPLVVTRLDTDSALTASSQKATANDSWFGEEDQKDEALSASETVIQFQIIAGERRWRASRMAGLTKVPVVLKEATPQEMLELALIENIQRADLESHRRGACISGTHPRIWLDPGNGGQGCGQRPLNYHQRSSPVNPCSKGARSIDQSA